MAQQSTFLVLLWIPMCIPCLHWQTVDNITLPKPLARSPFGTTFNNEYLYIFGGELSGQNDKSYMNSTSIVYKWWLDRDNKANWVSTNISMPNNTPLVCDVQCSITINESIYIVIPWTSSLGTKLLSNVIYQFDTNTLDWTLDLNNQMQHNISRSACIATNNTHIFVLGGLIDIAHAVNYNQIYDIEQNSWSLGSSYRADNWYRGSCIYHNKTQTIYVFGGETVDPNDADNIKFWSTIYKYFPVNDSWHQSSASLSVARSGSYAVMYHDTIYIIGGQRDDSFTYYNVVDAYDIYTDKCMAVANMSRRKAYPMVFTNNSYIYVMGGMVDVKPGASMAYKTVEIAHMSDSSDSELEHIYIVAGGVALVLIFVMVIVLKYKTKNVRQGSDANAPQPVINGNPGQPDEVNIPYQEYQEGGNDSDLID